MNWRWVNSRYKDHVALSLVLAFQRQCNLRQRLAFQCPQSAQLKSSSFMGSFIPSDFCFCIRKPEDTQNHKRKWKSIYNKSPNRFPEREFYCYWHSPLLITGTIFSMDYMWFSPSQESHGGENSPNNPHAGSRINASKWLNFPKVNRPRDGFFCFKIAFFLTHSIWLLLLPDHDHKDISNPCEKCDSVFCSVVFQRTVEVLGSETEVG